MNERLEPGTPRHACLEAIKDEKTKIWPAGWRDYSIDPHRDIRIAVINRPDCPEHILEAMEKNDPDAAIQILARSRLHALRGKPK